MPTQVLLEPCQPACPPVLPARLSVHPPPDALDMDVQHIQTLIFVYFSCPSIVQMCWTWMSTTSGRSCVLWMRRTWRSSTSGRSFSLTFCLSQYRSDVPDMDDRHIRTFIFVYSSCPSIVWMCRTWRSSTSGRSFPFISCPSMVQMCRSTARHGCPAHPDAHFRLFFWFQYRPDLPDMDVQHIWTADAYLGSFILSQHRPDEPDMDVHHIWTLLYLLDAQPISHAKDLRGRLSSDPASAHDVSLATPVGTTRRIPTGRPYTVRSP